MDRYIYIYIYYEGEEIILDFVHTRSDIEIRTIAFFLEGVDEVAIDGIFFGKHLGTTAIHGIDRIGFQRQKVTFF